MYCFTRWQKEWKQCFLITRVSLCYESINTCKLVQARGRTFLPPHDIGLQSMGDSPRRVPHNARRVLKSLPRLPTAPSLPPVSFSRSPWERAQERGIYVRWFVPCLRVIAGGHGLLKKEGRRRRMTQWWWRGKGSECKVVLDQRHKLSSFRDPLFYLVRNGVIMFSSSDTKKDSCSTLLTSNSWRLLA